MSFDPYALLDYPELAKAPGVHDGKRTVPCGCTRDDYSSSHDSQHPGQYENDYGEWETCGWCDGRAFRYAECTRCDGFGIEPAAPVPDVVQVPLTPTMHIIRRADGEEMGEFAFWATDGPDGWDHAEYADHDEDTVYEILACYPVARRKILWSTLCETCDGDGDGCPACAGSGEQEPPDAEALPILAYPAAASPGEEG